MLRSVVLAVAVAVAVAFVLVFVLVRVLLLVLRELRPGGQEKIVKVQTGAQVVSAEDWPMSKEVCRPVSHRRLFDSYQGGQRGSPLFCGA